MAVPAPHAEAAPRRTSDPAPGRQFAQAGYELSGTPKPAGACGMRSATVGNRAKGIPVRDVAAAGDWQDISTLIDCYQQPDDDTLAGARGVRQTRAASFGGGARRVRYKYSHSDSHTPQIGEARRQLSRCRASGDRTPPATGRNYAAAEGHFSHLSRTLSPASAKGEVLGRLPMHGPVSVHRSHERRLP